MKSEEFDKLTLPDLFAFIRTTAMEEQKRALISKQEAIKNYKYEQNERDRVLNEMRRGSEAQLASQLIRSRVPGSSHMYGRQGVSPHAIQSASAIRRRYR